MSILVSAIRRMSAKPGLLLAVGVLMLMGGCENAPPKKGNEKVKNNFSAGASEPGPVDADAPEKFTTTSSGLKYRIRRKGTGAKPKASNTVTVNYRGWLDDGKEFDSSYKRNDPTTFPLNRVVKGWTEGLQLVDEGGMIELEIPSDLGYGERGMPGAIPPNATLHFLVELLEIK